MRNPPRRRHAGFTLMEIMVVIAIIGLLLTLVGPQVFNRLKEARVTTAKGQMSTIIKPALEDFRRHFNKYPDSLEELTQPSAKNFNDSYLSQAQLLDPWEYPYHYTRISNSKFELVSFGADMLEGGEGEDADIPYETGALGN